MWLQAAKETQSQLIAKTKVKLCRGWESGIRILESFCNTESEVHLNLSFIVSLLKGAKTCSGGGYRSILQCQNVLLQLSVCLHHKNHMFVKNTISMNSSISKNGSIPDESVAFLSRMVMWATNKEQWLNKWINEADVSLYLLASVYSWEIPTWFPGVLSFKLQYYNSNNTHCFILFYGALKSSWSCYTEDLFSGV